MRRFSGKTYWLVGASEGLGRALAFKLSKAGADLVVSARSADRLGELVEELPGPARAVPCDISDGDSVARAAADVGDVDGFVFLAGVYWLTNARDWDAETIETMIDINFMGAVRVLGHVVPRMVEKGAGHIVITGSLSGFRGFPGAVGYCPGKAGVMSLGECMRIDLAPAGIVVQNANPGYIRTRLTDRNAPDHPMPQIMEPDEAAEHMMRLMRSDRFSSSFPWPFAALVRFGQFLPDWLYYRIF